MSTGLMPVDKLSAFYDPVRHRLTLGANGSVQPVTENIHFIRQPFVGGLLFELVGTTYGVMGPKEPYEISQKEDVSIFPFPKDVIVKTAESPKGKPVPIHWGGFGKETLAIEAGPSSVGGAEPSKVLPAPSEHTITQLLGEPFTIKQDAHVPKLGSVNIDFDTNHLELTDARINDTSIVWTFKGKTTGPTQALVFVAGGIADFVMRIPYNINIIVLSEADSK